MNIHQKKSGKKIIAVCAAVFVMVSVGFGVVSAVFDYHSDPEDCALLFYPKSPRDLWLLPRIGYNTYLAIFTDVELRRSRSRQRLLDGSIEKQVMEKWAKSHEQEEKIRAEYNRMFKDAQDATVERIQNHQSNGIKLFDRAQEPGLNEFGGFKWGDGLPANAQPISLAWADHPTDGLTFIVDGFTINTLGVLVEDDKFTVVDISPKSKKIYRVSKYIKHPVGTARDYLSRLRQKWHVTQGDSMLFFSNVTVKVEDRFYSYRGLRISAENLKLMEQAATESQELKNAEIDNDTEFLK